MHRPLARDRQSSPAVSTAHRPYGWASPTNECIRSILAEAYICPQPVPCFDSEPPPVRPGLHWPTPPERRAAPVSGTGRPPPPVAQHEPAREGRSHRLASVCGAKKQRIYENGADKQMWYWLSSLSMTRFLGMKYRVLDPVRTLKLPPGSGSTKRGLMTPQSFSSSQHS